jgi:hypothetical protein
VINTRFGGEVWHTVDESPIHRMIKGMAELAVGHLESLVTCGLDLIQLVKHHCRYS